MAQIKVSAQLTNGSSQVVIPDEDLRADLFAGFLLNVQDELGTYVLGADPTFSPPNTILQLTAPYAGSTGTKEISLVTDYSVPDGIPLINPGDVHTAAIFSSAMLRIQELFSNVDPTFALAKVNNLSDLLDAAAARTNLGLSNVENKSAAQILAGITGAMVVAALGFTPWHAGNDGANSGLDADLLDGQDSAFYRDAGNINAGTLPAARLGASPTAAKVLWGDNTWRALAAGDITTAIGYTPVNRAADTMQGNLSFASGAKIVQTDEWGVKWQLSGIGNSVELNLANTSWDFSHSTAGGVDKWRFIDNGNIRLQIDATGASINGLRLNSSNGLLKLENGTTDHELRIFNHSVGADWEALRLQATDAGAFITTGQGGTGVARSLSIGTSGDADLSFYRNGANRWLLKDSALVPVSSYDIGSSVNKIQDLWLSRRINFPTLTLPGLPPVAGADDQDTGLRWSAANQLALVTGGTDRLTIDGTAINTGGIPLWLGANAKINTDGAGVVSMRDGSIPYLLNLYKNEGADYERLAVGWSSTIFKIGAEAGGLGIQRALRFDGSTLQLATGGTTRIQVNTASVEPNGAMSLGLATARFGAGFIDSLQQYLNYTNATNYEWAGAEWSGTDWIIGSRAAGTGQYRNVVIRTGSSSSVGRVRFIQHGSIGGFQLAGDDDQVHAAMIADAAGVFINTFQAKPLVLQSATNTVQVKASTSAQSFQVYNTDDGAGNYERAEMRWGAGSLIIGSAFGGTGVARDLQFEVGNLAAWQITAAGRHLLPSVTDSLDLGSGTLKLHDGYFSGTVNAGTFAGGAALTGTPTAPTAVAGTNTTQIATTAFVTAAVSGSVAGVSSFNTRTGAVTLSSADVTGALGYTPWHAGNDGVGSGLDADMVDGYNADPAATGNTLAVRNASGYLFATYLNQSSAAESIVVGNVFVEQINNDGYLRKMSLANFRSALGGAGTGLNADMTDGFHANTGVVGNTLAARDVNGYLFAAYFNQSSGVENPTIGNFFVENTAGDGYHRKASFAYVAGQLHSNPAFAGLAKIGLNGLGGTALATTGVLVDSGTIGNSAGNQVPIANFGGHTGAGNSQTLGLRMHRAIAGSDWQGVGYVFEIDVDSSPGVGGFWMFGPRNNFHIGNVAQTDGTNCIVMAEGSTPTGPVAGAGILFVNSSGQLYYRGPSGTQTLLAGP